MNHKRARAPHIDDIVVAHFPCEDARAKRPVSANIYASQESHESHGGMIKKRTVSRNNRSALPHVNLPKTTTSRSRGALHDAGNRREPSGSQHLGPERAGAACQAHTPESLPYPRRH